MFQNYSIPEQVDIITPSTVSYVLSISQGLPQEQCVDVVCMRMTLEVIIRRHSSRLVKCDKLTM